MRIEVPHHTTRANARKQVEQKIDALLSRFGGQADEIEHSWTGDTLSFKGKARGFSVEGSLEVTDSSVILESKLPFMAKPFEPRIADAVRKEAEQMFRA
jgi:hypothetical protein